MLLEIRYDPFTDTDYCHWPDSKYFYNYKFSPPIRVYDHWACGSRVWMPYYWPTYRLFKHYLDYAPSNRSLREQRKFVYATNPITAIDYPETKKDKVYRPLNLYYDHYWPLKALNKYADEWPNYDHLIYRNTYPSDRFYFLKGIFDDETRLIRAQTAALLKRVHSPVPRAQRSWPVSTMIRYDDGLPTRYTNDNYIHRLLTASSRNPKVEYTTYYTEPVKKYIGQGRLSCVSYAGDRAYNRRRHIFLYEDPLRSDIQLLSYYINKFRDEKKALQSSGTNKVPLSPARPSRIFSKPKLLDDSATEEIKQLREDRAARLAKIYSESPRAIQPSSDVDEAVKAKKKKEEARLAEEKAIAEEQAKKQAQAKKEEAARKAELARQEKLAAQAAAERAAELEKQAELARQLELAKQAEIENAKKLEEERIHQEEQKRIEEEIKAEEERKQLLRLEELARQAEEEKEAELARQAEELAELARQEAELAEQAKKQAELEEQARLQAEQEELARQEAELAELELKEKELADLAKKEAEIAALAKQEAELAELERQQAELDALEAEAKALESNAATEETEAPAEVVDQDAELAELEKQQAELDALEAEARALEGENVPNEEAAIEGLTVTEETPVEETAEEEVAEEEEE